MLNERPKGVFLCADVNANYMIFIDKSLKLMALGVKVDLLHLDVGTHHEGELQQEMGAQHQGCCRSFVDGVYGALTKHLLTNAGEVRP